MLLLCLTALAADTVTIQVGGLDVPVEARAVWLGNDLRLPLTDTDGDGVLTGTLSGAELRLLPLSLWVGAEPVEAWRAIVPVGMGEQTLSFTTLRTDPPTLQQASAPRTPTAIARQEVAMLVGWFAWLLLALVGLVWLIRHRAPAAVADWRWWWSIPLWAALSVLWTWPAVTAGGGAMIGRHFDLMGTIWAMDASSRLLEGGLHDALTAWPLGRDARRFDSFTLLPISTLLADFGMDRLHGALQIVGVFLLGFFGERFARGLGAKGWWGLVGGAALALSGLSANVLLEGHVYHLLNPWLPLLGLVWWRATGTGSRWIWGALSGAMFGLCLLTTAYVGMAAAIVVIGFALPALQRRATWPAMAAAAVTAALFAVPYIWLFLQGDSGSRGHGDIQSALNLAAMAPVTPELIRIGFARSLAPSAALLALSIAAIALPSIPRRLTLLLTGLLALALSAGMLPAAIAPPTLFRFPVRLGWAYLLCIGALAAVGGTALEARSGRLSRLLVLLVFVEPFAVGWPGRIQQRQMSTTPAAYQVGEGAIIDLLPQDTDRGASLGVILSRQVCLYQTQHDRPIAEDCFEAPVREGPRLQIESWLYDHLLRGDIEGAYAALARLGFSGIALHPDLFDASTRSWLQQRLQQFDTNPTISTSGGEHVMLYRLQPNLPPNTDLSFAYTDTETTAVVGDSHIDAEGAPWMRIELIIPSSYRGNGFWATLSDSSGREWTAELYDDGRHPRDLPNDDVWVGLMEGPLPHQGTLDIYLRGPQFSERSWSGQAWMQPPLTEHRFRLSVNHSRITPMLASTPTSSSPAITPHNNRVIAIGWILWLLGAVVVGVRIRRGE